MRGILGKTMGCIMGYNRQYFEIIGYIKEKTRDILAKKGLRLSVILWVIFGKNYGIYLEKYGIYL